MVVQKINHVRTTDRKDLDLRVRVMGNPARTTDQKDLDLRQGSGDGQSRSYDRPKRSRPSGSGDGQSRSYDRPKRSRPSGGSKSSRPAGSSRAKYASPELYKPNDGIRLNKFLADSGLASRRKAEELISKGFVRVNRKVVKELGTRVKHSDFVTVNGNPVNAEKHLTYIILNKPKDIITTASDEKNRKTVMDIVKSRERIYPVGRLDRNTTGLLLLTNDGELTTRLLHPSYSIERTYKVGLNKELKFSHAEEIVKGVEIDVGTTSPCEIFIDPKDNSHLSITLREGKNREIRKIFEKFGYDVRKLDRKYFGNLSTSGMKRGQYRHLSRKEVNELKRLVKL
jgi:23S rRNA pseudouridine2605 synthase